MRTYLASFALLAACTTAKQPVDDDFTSFVGQDAKSDAFSNRMKILGSLDYGQTSNPIEYTRWPRYRAYTFSGHPSDVVDVWVRSSDNGDAYAWVLDNQFKIVAKNDDADDSTLDAHIHATLPASLSDAHYIVFRDYAMSSAHFTTQLTGGPALPSCQTDDDCAAVTIAPNDTRVAQCDFTTYHCQLIAPTDIRCGGFTTHPHQCPAPYVCHINTIPDIPGTCGQQ